jgi:hypothetical protein
LDTHKESKTITAVKRSIWGNKAISFVIPEGDLQQTLLRVRVKPITSTIVVSVANWTLIAALSLKWVNRLMEITYANFSLTWLSMMSFQYFCIGILTFFAFWLPHVIKKRMTDLEKSFWKTLGTNHALDTAEAIAPEVFPIWLIILRDFFFLVLISYISHYLGGLFVFFVIVVLVSDKFPRYSELLFQGTVDQS